MLYNIPGRCSVDISADTVERLAAECPSIVAIKEASGSVDRVSELRARLPNEFAILSGDDSLTLPFMSVGAVGVVSVASNLIPASSVRPGHAQEAGDVKSARRTSPTVAADFQRSLHRTQSGADQNGAELARHDVSGGSFTTLRDDRSKSGTAAQNI